MAFDGLPYECEAVQQRIMMEQIRQGSGPFWGPTRGPDAYLPAQIAHKKVDRLTGVLPENRSPRDRLPERVIDELERWLDDSGADEIVKWSHTLLAHAAGPTSRNRSAIAAAAPTADKITGCIRAFVRVAEAVTNTILGHSARGMLVPMPQFNPFAGRTTPLAPQDSRRFLDACWDRFTKERNEFLEGIETELITKNVSGEVGGAF